jgi:hypothetical protein
MRPRKKLEEVRDFHAPESDVVSIVQGLGKGGGSMTKELFELAMTPWAWRERALYSPRVSSSESFKSGMQQRQRRFPWK